MAEYYKTDSRKISLREYWNIHPSWKVLIPWIAGRFNIPFGLGACIQIPDHVSELEVGEADFPAAARARLQPLVQECLSLGFHSPRYYRMETLRRDTTASFISLLHGSGQYSIRLIHSIGTKVSPPIEMTLAVLMSELSDGTFFFTSNDKPKFRPIPGTRVNRLTGAPVSRLLESHQQQLDSLRGQNPARPTDTVEKMDDMWNRYERHYLDANLKRGLFVRMDPAELAHEQKVMSGAEQLAGPGGEHADVMVELSRLQNRRAGWSSTIWILIVSVVLFLVAGAGQWPLDYLLILLPVLFIHETGHYVAMRVFHYRNLRMFFIPFFGAAVTGEHYNVPGWKKVVVSLMGPLPGIVIGTVLAVAGMVFHIDILNRIALIAVIVNGFNLLPLLPMDGGWIAHSVLFCRHPLFDSIFRVLAAVGAFIVGAWMKSEVFIFLGIPMLLSVAAHHRMGKLALELRKRGLPPVSDDAQSIPPATAHAIITEVRKTMPAGHTSRMVAEQTLQVFEMMNARPPGVLASIGLLTAYVASMGLALIVPVLIGMAHYWHFGSAIQEMTEAATRSITTAPLGWPRVYMPAIPGNPVTFVANFTNQAAARAAFFALTNHITAPASVKYLGESVFMTLTADSGRKEALLEELKRQAMVTLEERSNPVVCLNLQCRFPSPQQARAIGDELRQYLAIEFTTSLIPPFLPEDFRPPEQRAAHQLARLSFEKARMAQEGWINDARASSLKEQFHAAAQNYDTDEQAKLARQMQTLASRITSEEYEHLKNGAEGPVDVEMIDLYSMWSENPDAEDRAEALPGLKRLPQSARAPGVEIRNISSRTNIISEMLSRMGEIPPATGPDEGAGRYSMETGSVTVNKDKVTLHWGTFTHIAEGMPALIEWLSNNGASDLKYEMFKNRAFETDEDP